MILSKSNNSNNNFEDDNDNSLLTAEVQNLFCDLLRNELELIQVLAETAFEIQGNKDFTTYEAYIYIDVQNKKYLDEVSVKNFLSNNGYDINDNEAGGIVFRLDNDGDGKVSYEEFQKIFFPLGVESINGSIGFSGGNSINSDGFVQSKGNYSEMNSNKTGSFGKKKYEIPSSYKNDSSK